MKDPEFQPKLNEEIVVLKNYFSYLRYKGDVYIDMKIAAEKFVIGMGITNDEDEASRLVDALLPLYNEDAPKDSLEAWNILTTLPLVLAGDYVDMNMNIRDAGLWYDEVLDHITKFNSFKTPEHTPAVCLESPYFAFTPATCQLESEHCPVITTAKYLDKHIFDTEADMTGEWYALNNPAIMRDVAVLKQQLARDHGFADAHTVERNIRVYNQRFRNVYEL